MLIYQLNAQQCSTVPKGTQALRSSTTKTVPKETPAHRSTTTLPKGLFTTLIPPIIN
jgi:hypothetical protein